MPTISAMENGPTASPPRTNRAISTSIVVRLVDGCVEEFEDPVKDVKYVNKKYVYAACEAAKKSPNVYDYDPKGEPGKKNIEKLTGKEGDKLLAKVNIAMRNGCGMDENHYSFDA